MNNYNNALLKNGIDFMEKSLAEFKESPKYSILHFAIAIEILLKVRLAIEHWSLVVQKNPIKANYEKGDFISVNLDEAIKRLRNIVGEKISDTEYKSFKKIAAHRNKVIHFYHTDIETENGLQKIITEQCEAWYHVRTLFTKKWRNLFADYIDTFEMLDWRMKQHWEYLSTIFEKKKNDIEKLKKRGEHIDKCSYCSFESVHYNLSYPELKSGYCLVCSRPNTVINLECECGNSITFRNEGWGECTSCGKKYEPEDVYKLIDNLGYDISEWPDKSTPANCQFCGGYHTVAALHDFYIVHHVSKFPIV